MDGRQHIITEPLLLSIFLSLILFTFPITLSSAPLTYHTFSLTQPPTHVPAPSNQSVTTNEFISLPLHHVDSLNRTKTLHERLRHRLDLDGLRVQALMAPKQRHGSILLNSSVYSGLKQGMSSFFTRLKLGNPAQTVQLLVDTGSDLTWLQCKPCKRCYYQTGPIFNPTQSKSFSPVGCGSKICEQQHQEDHKGCSQKQGCGYEVQYGDGSVTIGQLATETLTFHKTRLAHFTVGCGYKNTGLFSGAAGIFGLGLGKSSFLSQKGHLFGNTFSYCLKDLVSDWGGSSWLIFGKTALSRRAIFTPMLVSSFSDSFYTVRLSRASIGGAPVRLPGAVEMIVDSGTTITWLEKGAYEALRNSFRARNKHLKMVDSPPLSALDTCFDFSGREKVKVSTLELHFEGKASMFLPAENYLIPLDEKGTYCLAMAPSAFGFSVLGNVQQQGFRIMFDVQKKRVGFAARSC